MTRRLAMVRFRGERALAERGAQLVRERVLRCASTGRMRRRLKGRDWNVGRMPGMAAWWQRRTLAMRRRMTTEVTRREGERTRHEEELRGERERTKGDKSQANARAGWPQSERERERRCSNITSRVWNSRFLADQAKPNQTVCVSGHLAQRHAGSSP